MDATGLVNGFATLGPALGSVVAISLICYYLITLIVKLVDRLIKLLDNVGGALVSISERMDSMDDTQKQLSQNVRANTESTERMTEKMVELLQAEKARHSTYAPIPAPERVY